MIPQEELDRALRRWKAKKLGQDVPQAVAEEHSAQIEDASPLHDEPTRVASPHYSSHMETPAAEVNLGADDYEDHTHRKQR